MEENAYSWRNLEALKNIVILEMEVILTLSIRVIIFHFLKVN